MNGSHHPRSQILFGGCSEAAPVHDANGMMHFMTNVKELPTLSPVAMRVVGMLLNADTTARDLAQVIENDPAMVGKLFKLVNSSFYGFSSRISSVIHAIMILGFNTVLNAVLSMSVMDAFKIRTYKRRGIDLTRLWHHAIGVAVVAKHLGRCMGGDNDNAFTAGILHDIGKIVMAIFFSERFIEMQRSEDARQGNFLRAEKQYFPIGHASLGAFLADRWKLPDELTTVIAQHHQHDKPGGNIVTLVQTADAIVNIHVEKNGTEEKWPICNAARDLMDDKIGATDQWLTEVGREIRASCEAMLEG
jgi:putative nucleotidyltransferase with HDIG domain